MSAAVHAHVSLPATEAPTDRRWSFLTPATAMVHVTAPTLDAARAAIADHRDAELDLDRLPAGIDISTISPSATAAVLDQVDGHPLEDLCSDCYALIEDGFYDGRCSDCWTDDMPEDDEESAPDNQAPFTIADIADETAKLLGQGWRSRAWNFGASGTVLGPYVTGFRLNLDHENDLCIDFDRWQLDRDENGFPETPELPDFVGDCGNGVFLFSTTAKTTLKGLAKQCAAAIRAASGYNPDDYDFTSSASSQHYIETGRYLRKGQADQA
jgi:hypothetical protein